MANARLYELVANVNGKLFGVLQCPPYTKKCTYYGGPFQVVNGVPEMLADSIRNHFDKPEAALARATKLADEVVKENTMGRMVFGPGGVCPGMERELVFRDKPVNNISEDVYHWVLGERPFYVVEPHEFPNLLGEIIEKATPIENGAFEADLDSWGTFRLIPNELNGWTVAPGRLGAPEGTKNI